MPVILLKRGSSDAIKSYSGKQGELVVDVENNRLKLMTGSLAGGRDVAFTDEISSDITTVEQWIALNNGYFNTNDNYRDFLDHTSSDVLSELDNMNTAYFNN